MLVVIRHFHHSCHSCQEAPEHSFGPIEEHKKFLRGNQPPSYERVFLTSAVIFSWFLHYLVHFVFFFLRRARIPPPTQAAQSVLSAELHRAAWLSRGGRFRAAPAGPAESARRDWLPPGVSRLALVCSDVLIYTLYRFPFFLSVHVLYRFVFLVVISKSFFFFFLGKQWQNTFITLCRGHGVINLNLQRQRPSPN